MTRSPVAALGALLGDGTRADLLALLMDGRARTVGELARATGVAVSTASGHLARLLEGGLLAVEAQGRHRYYRLAGPQVAELIEAVIALPLGGVDPPPSRTPSELRFARTCYDHLAGALGVAICDRLGVTEGDGCGLPPDAASALADLAVDLPVSRRRPMLRTCLDWSERRPHLAGAVGAALLAVMLERRWLVRRVTPRAVRLTPNGRSALTAALGPHECWG